MFRLKVVGDPAECAKVLKTNRPLEIGTMLTCGAPEAMVELAQKHPMLFELVRPRTVKADLPAILDEEEKEQKPRANKLLKKNQVKHFTSK